MAHKAITLKFVVPTLLAVALGIMISGAGHLTDKQRGAVDQAKASQSGGGREIAELPNPELSRVRLLLSR